MTVIYYAMKMVPMCMSMAGGGLTLSVIIAFMIELLSDYCLEKKHQNQAEVYRIIIVNKWGKRLKNNGIFYQSSTCDFNVYQIYKLLNIYY